MISLKKVLPALILGLTAGFVLIHPTIAQADFPLELDASYEGGELILDFSLGTSEPAMWVNHLILTIPAVQVIQLFSSPLPVIDPPSTWTVSFPFPSLGVLGILTGLFTDGGQQAIEMVWVDTGSSYQRDLPDSGVDLCYDDTMEITCPSPGEPFYGQDAQYEINPMNFTHNDDGTVTDNVTGLMWQQEDDGIERRLGEAMAYCEDLELADYSDWRLPDNYELQSIVDYGRHDPAVDTSYFPGIDSDWFWSSSPEDPWAIDFYHVMSFFGGKFYGMPYYYGHKVMCVRGTSTTKLFTDNDDGTVTDNMTGLMWQQVDDDRRKNWEGALEYCESLDLAGHTDWRLPQIKELNSIVDYTRTYPAIDTTYFPVTKSKYYCSSTTAFPDYYGAEYSLNVTFGPGVMQEANKSIVTTYLGSYVRCVR